MRIALVNQFFYPDTAATSQILTDLARELSALGHDVTAICGASDYAEADNTHPPPVKIIRSKLLPFARSRFGRIASYATFFIWSAISCLSQEPPDVILTLTTPPLLSLIGTLVKRIRGSRHFIWEMDLYPEIAVDLGVFRANAVPTKIIRVLARYSRLKADGIIALGDDMKERLLSQELPSEKIHVVHNWADRAEIQPQPMPPPPLTVHYSGNLGLAHDTSTIQNAMLALSANEHTRFVFSGSGPQKKAMQDFCELNQIHQSIFRPYCTRDQLSNSLAAGHLGLVTQKPETVGSIVPSKVYGIMAAGRPLLYIGSVRATPARIIERFNCGWFIEAGDSESLVELLRNLANQPDEIRTAGQRARRAFVENFDRRIGAATIAEILGAQEQRVAATA
jgi:colanic acid biosynthesis glycosyl transferase WcaI